jgi:hypothetical protein
MGGVRPNVLGKNDQFLPTVGHACLWSLKADACPGLERLKAEEEGERR